MSARRDEVHDFVRQHSAGLQRLAWVLTGDAQQAEDLVQVTLLRTWRSWPRVRDAADPLAYVRRTMVNAHSTGSRRRWRGELASDAVPDTPVVDGAEQVTDREALRHLLTALAPRQRAAVVLRYLEDLDDAAIADVLGCSVQTVRSQISRALATLRVAATEEALR